MIPTSNEAKRVAALAKRPPTSHWNEKEIKRFREIKDKFNDEDLTLLEGYYKSEWQKKDPMGKLIGIHRRDLYTLLNNFYGELDRARAWREKQPKKRLQTTPASPNYPPIVRDALEIFPGSSVIEGKPLSDDEFKTVGSLAIAELRRCRESIARGRDSRCGDPSEYGDS